MSDYTIWTLKTWTGDKADCLARYSNRGHALAKLRGLRRASWRAASEMQYALQDERPIPTQGCPPFVVPAPSWAERTTENGPIRGMIAEYGRFARNKARTVAPPAASVQAGGIRQSRRQTARAEPHHHRSARRRR